MKTPLSLLLFVILFGAVIESPAQSVYRYYKNWYFSGNLGAATFYGDVSDKKNRLFSDSPFSSFYYEDRGAAFVLDFGKDISPSFSTGLSVGTAKLKAHSDILVMYMESTIYTYGVNGKVHALNMILGPSNQRPLDIYGTLGLSGLSYSTYKWDQRTDKLIGMNDPENPGYQSGKLLSSSTVFFNYGFGIDVKVSDNTSICFETSSNRVFDDKLDAHVSDKRNFEGFGLTTIGLKYHFDTSPYVLHGGRYPKYNGKSKEPAIKQYNKKKAVVMKTKPHNKALNNRYNQKTGRSHFSFRGMFRKTKLNFAK